MTWLAILASAVVGGIAWRVRGAAFGSTTFSWVTSGVLVRLLSAVAMALVPALVHGPLALLLAPVLFLGMSLAGWGDDFDIGRNGGQQAAETASMSAWGLLAVAPAVVVLLWLRLSPWPLLLAGLAFGPVYAATWHLGPRLPKVRRFAQGPTEWAEVVCGALIGAALAAA